MGNRRDEYVNKLKAQLDDWNALIDRWEEQARNRSEDARRESEKRLNELRRKRDELRARLPEIQSAGEQAFEDLRDGANRAWKELSSAFDRARSHFKSEEPAGPEA